MKSIFQIDLSKHKNNLFGTSDIKHPGYHLLKKMGNYFAGGPVNSFFKIDYKYSNYSMSPSECKSKIKKFGLKTVAGFQTRNVPHKAHEYIISNALKEVDAVLIHPLIGRKKKGDFVPAAVIKSYEHLIKEVY